MYPYGFRGGTPGTAQCDEWRRPAGHQRDRAAPQLRAQDAVRRISNTTSPTAPRPTCRPTTARTEGDNKNPPTRGNYCVRFDSTGTAGNNAAAGTVWTFSTTTPGIVNGQAYIGLRPVRRSSSAAPVSHSGRRRRRSSGLPVGGNNVADRQRHQRH